MLRIVPQGSNGVTVVIIHYQTWLIELWTGAGFSVGHFDELIHQAAIHGRLFVTVVMVLITGQRFIPAQAHGIGTVRVVVQQGLIEAIDLWRAFAGNELRLAVRVFGIGISREIMVEGHVFLVNDNDVFDRCRG